ncbi:MAG: protein kinase [Bacteroidales bacterium]|nr:protein kinase [Bacteroidales bacterium]
MILQDADGVLNHYHFEIDPTAKPLGIGGMGQVLPGVRIDENTGHRRDVAVKFLYDDLHPSAIDRAKREALIQIQHPNLVEMIAFVQITDKKGQVRSHVVSELLRGVALSNLMKGELADNFGEQQPMIQQWHERMCASREAFAVDVVKEVLEGLGKLHACGYIHRDLSPNNIMVTHEGAMKVIDLGIALRFNTPTTGEKNVDGCGAFIGKPAYAAPELVNHDTDAQNETTDVYAMGIILYQLATGSLPFDGNDAEVMQKQRFEDVPVENIGNKALRKVIKKATAKKQDDRYPTAEAFIAALNKVKIETATPGEDSSKGGDNGNAPGTGMQETGASSTEKPKKSKGLLIAGICAVAVAVVAGIVAMGGGGSSSQPQSHSMPEGMEQAQPQPQPTHVSLEKFTDAEGETFTYTGEVENGKPNGQGTGIYPYGNYTGEYKDGYRVGQGVFESKDGTNKYEGTFAGDKYNKGKLTFSDGSYFEGTFKNGQPAKGKWYDKNGNVESVE